MCCGVVHGVAIVTVTCGCCYQLAGCGSVVVVASGCRHLRIRVFLSVMVIVASQTPIKYDFF